MFSSWNYWPGEELPRQVVLTDEAKDILGDGSERQLKEFTRYCGDSYIGSIFSGAEVLATMSFSSSSTSESNQSKKSAKVALKAWSVSGGAQASKSGASQVEDKDIEIDMEFAQIGGSGGIIPTDRNQFFQKLNDLPAEALRGPEFHSMMVKPYNSLPDWPQNISFKPADESIEEVLTNYYATMTSINYLLVDLNDQAKMTAAQLADTIINEISREDGEVKTLEELPDFISKTKDKIHSPQVARLNLVEDKINALRSRTYELLSQSYVLDQIEEPLTSRWKFWKQNEKSQHELDQQKLKADMETHADELHEFSFGVNNPNLIKLYLPTPGEPVSSGEGENTTRGIQVVETYLASQAKRMCQQTPASSECLTNAVLTKLATCVPVSPEWLAIPESCEFGK